MRDRLDSTVLNVIDIQDQPASSFVFVIEGMLGPRQAFAVDGIHVKGELIHGYLGPDASPLYTVSVHQRAPWALLSRSVLEPYPVRESIAKAAADGKAVQDHEGECLKQYFPDQIITKKPTETEGSTVTPKYPVVGHYI